MNLVENFILGIWTHGICMKCSITGFTARPRSIRALLALGLSLHPRCLLGFLTWAPQLDPPWLGLRASDILGKFEG